jgi:hypothetical protein
MEKHEDPLAIFNNKAMELAEEAGKLYHLDEKQIDILASRIRLNTMSETVQIKCNGFLILDETASMN